MAQLESTIRPTDTVALLYGIRIISYGVPAPPTATLSGTASLSAYLERPYAVLLDRVAIDTGPKIIQQGRMHGPFQNTGRDLYVWAYDSGTDELRVYTSQDRLTWTHLSVAKLSTWGTSNRWTTYQGPIGTAYENKIYLAKQDGDTNAEVRFWQFDMSTEVWDVSNELVKSTYNATLVRGALYPCVSIAHRYATGTYQIVIIYNGLPHSSGFERVDAAFKEPLDITWTTDIRVDKWLEQDITSPGTLQEYAASWVFNTAATDRNDDSLIHIWHQDLGTNGIFWKTLRPDEDPNIVGAYVEPFALESDVSPNFSDHFSTNLHLTPMHTTEYEPIGFCTPIKQATTEYTIRTLLHYEGSTYPRGEVSHTETDVNNIIEYGDIGPGETAGGPFTTVVTDASIAAEEPDFHWNGIANCVWDGDKAAGTNEEEHHIAYIGVNSDQLLYTYDSTGNGYFVSSSLRTLTAPDSYVITGNLAVLGAQRVSVFGFIYNDNGSLYYEEKRLTSLEAPGFPTGTLAIVGNAEATIDAVRITAGTFSADLVGDGTVATLIGTKVREPVSPDAITLSSSTTVTSDSQIIYRSASIPLTTDTVVNAATSIPVTGSIFAVGEADAIYWQGTVTPKYYQQSPPVEIIVYRYPGNSEGDPIVDQLLTSNAVALSRGQAELDRLALPVKTYEVDVLYRTNFRLGQLLEVHDLLFNEIWLGKLAGITHKINATSSAGTWTSLSIERPIK